MCLRNSFERHDYRDVEPMTPFTEDLRTFLKRCREEQTLFANLEGRFEKREFKKSEKSSLYAYVLETISGKNYTQNLETEARNLTKKILEISCSLCPESYVYCSNIWLHYYEYENSINNVKSIPLFKIFEGKHKEKYFVLDTNMKLYYSFDKAVSEINLPPSFFCVPRNGKYNFVGDKLDLEFICSKNPDGFVVNHESYTPFCQRIKSFFIDVGRLNFMDIICDAVQIFSSLIPGGENVVPSLVYIVVGLKNIFSSTRKVLHSGLMLLHEEGKNFIEATENTNPLSSPKSEDEIRRNLTVLVDLAQKQRWKELSFVLCETCLAFDEKLLLKVISFCPNWMRGIFCVISVAKLISKVWLAINKDDPEFHNLNYAIQNDPCKSPTGNLHIQAGNRVQETKDKPLRGTIDFKDAIRNLEKLSVMSSSSFEKSYIKELPKPETHIEVLLLKNGIQFLAVEDGMAFFIIHHASMNRINYYSNMMNVCLEPEGEKKTKLIRKTDKKEIGVFHYPSELVVFGWIYEEELPENININEVIKSKDTRLTSLGLSLENKR